MSTPKNPSMHPDSGLVVSQVTHHFGDFCAVCEVDLRIAPGQVHCLLGPSGSGKSTLLRLVAGLERLQRGRISINGVDVARAVPESSGAPLDSPPERRSIGFVFQDYALFPHLNVLRNVSFGMADRSSTGSHGAARELLDRVGLGPYAEAMPHTLSGGQQQRVALARALARQPDVMLLDEPFSGLDTRLRHDIRQRTLSILQAEGVATLMVTHDPGEALSTSDVVSVIRHGHIVQSGSPTEVYGRSFNRDVAEVFGPVNALVGRVDGGTVATPFGPLDASHLESGQPAQVLVRPESLIVQVAEENGPSPGHAPATIRSVAREGAIVHIEVVLDDGLAITVHDLTRSPWRAADRVHVSLVSGAAMVRPVTSS